MHEWLPLFPLQVVLLPGGELPLHIFEDRYKEMIADIRRDRTEFGVVLASDKGISGIGCTAAIDRILSEYPDGRLDLVAIGHRRFEITRLNEEHPYLRCSADFFDDDIVEPAAPEVRTRAIAGYNAFRALNSLAALGDAEALDARLSFILARAIEDLDLRQSLLVTRSEASRLRQLADFFPSFLHRQRQVQHVKQVAPRNGHGGKVKDIS